MTASARAGDLFVLVADSNMEHAVRGLLGRSVALGISDIQSKVFRHPNRDPGCLGEGRDFIKPFSGQYDHALIMFDREGCGHEDRSAIELEDQLANELKATDWKNRAAAVVIEPELEAWVWSDSPHVDAVLGWKGRDPSLRDWLVSEKYLGEGTDKPGRPKEAMEKALYLVRKPRSSAVFAELAGKVSLSRCTDRSFTRFKSLLQGWFPRS